jgi:hypothetical protein
VAGGGVVNAVTFLASMPPIQSAVKISGGGDGMRVQFDVPETEMGNAVELLAMRGVVLRVTVEALLNKTDAYGQPELGKGRKRKSRWQATEGAGADGDT